MPSSTTRRDLLAKNPLDAVKAPSPLEQLIPSGPPTTEPSPAVPLTPSARPAASSASTGEATPMRTKPAQVKHTFGMPGPLLEDVRDAVDALSGPPHRMTLAAFLEAAFTAELRRLEVEVNGGAPFPKRDGALRTGRQATR